MASVTRSASATAGDHSTAIDNSIVDYGSDYDWSTLGNMAASDDAWATANASTTVAGQTYRLDIKNFGFAIPTGATINGIEVSIERGSSNTARAIEETQVRLVKAGAPAGANKATGTVTTEVVAVRGGATDLWGTTWSVADINSAGFGVALQFARNAATLVSIRVDQVQVTVYYTTGGTVTTVSPGAAHITFTGHQPTVSQTGGGTTSEAIAEAYASAPSDLIIYHTIELYHAAFSVPIRVVLDSVSLDARLEASAPRDSSQVVTFTGYSFSIKPPDVMATGMPTCILEIDNVDRAILAQIELAQSSTDLVEVIYRQYLTGRTDAGPENDPPLKMTAMSIMADLFRIRAECGMGDMVNKRFPSDLFTSERFPGLVLTT